MARGLFLFMGAFAGGVAVRSLYDLGENFAFAFFLIFLGSIFFIFYKINDLRCHYILYVAIVFLALGLGVLRFDVADLHKGSPSLDAHVKQEVVLAGIIIDEPDTRENHTKLTFRVDKIFADEQISQPFYREKGREEGVSFAEIDSATKAELGVQKERDLEIRGSKMLLITEHYPEFRYGDEIIVRGKLEKPKNFTAREDNVGRPFDYVAWLAKDGIFYQSFYPEIELLVPSDVEGVAHKQGNPVKYYLFSFKHMLLENASRILPEPHSSLLGGITLGAKRALGKELLEDFRKTGIIHIVVLSGYNITIVAEAIGRVASFFPRVIGLTLSVSAILAFAVMTGAGATIVRASLMALLVLFARTTGRLYEITIALFSAGFLMVLWNPKILLFDPSFQLSFLATFGLIHLAPRLEQHFGRLPTKWQLREAATATIAAQIFVLPLLLFLMGKISLVAVPVNLFILPTIPLVMFSGFLTSLVAFASDALAFLPAATAFLFLEYELRVVDVFASLPFADITISNFSAPAMVFVYALYGTTFYLLWRRGK